MTVAAIEWFFSVAITRKGHSAPARAVWLQSLCQRISKVVDVEIEYEGIPPAHGLLVSNHLSYLDIIVIGARHPVAFVAKKEVRSWPFIGWLAACGGTLFINRECRAEVGRVADQLRDVMAQGTVVCIFPEGTSSDGTDVLPFRSSLLQPAIDAQCAVTPMWVGYSLAKGCVEDEVCYWRDMSFGPHFVNLLKLTGLKARVCFGGRRLPGSDRKRLATELRADVRRLDGVNLPLSRAA